ncbi:MAG: nucleoside deaminase, partial [Verrucomicrobia bacterium]|nr:nucleoside deaminase [Verrucomicrobiota bacterium]
EKLIYGAEGSSARRVGFDEGDKVTDWQNALEQRGIRVVGPLLKEKAEEPFELYRSMSGVVY